MRMEKDVKNNRMYEFNWIFLGCFLTETAKRWGGTTTKKIKKCNRNIIAVKTVKCYNIREYGMVYPCAIFTMYKLKRQHLCRLNSKNDKNKQLLFFAAEPDCIRGFNL